MAIILDGKALAERIRSKIKMRVSHLSPVPGLAVLLVGDDPASHTYVNIKQKACEEVGIYFEKFLYDKAVSEEILLQKIIELNHRKEINGILVQLPLPSQNADTIITAIDPKKDVDGFHPDNLNALKKGQPAIVSAVALGVMRLISLATKQTLTPKTAVVISSTLFGEPLIPLLREQSIDGMIVNETDEDLVEKTKQADVIIIALGKPGFLTGEMIKSGAIVIDIGTTKIDDTLYGDVDVSTVESIAGALSPVPGGVGPMTVAMLLSNVLKAYQLQSAWQENHPE